MPYKDPEKRRECQRRSRIRNKEKIREQKKRRRHENNVKREKIRLRAERPVVAPEAKTALVPHDTTRAKRKRMKKAMLRLVPDFVGDKVIKKYAQWLGNQLLYGKPFTFEDFLESRAYRRCIGLPPMTSAERQRRFVRRRRGVSLNIPPLGNGDHLALKYTNFNWLASGNGCRRKAETERHVKKMNRRAIYLHNYDKQLQASREAYVNNKLAEREKLLMAIGGGVTMKHKDILIGLVPGTIMIIVIALAVGCNRRDDKGRLVMNRNIDYLVFDGHEYVYMRNGGGMTHSPKCECLQKGDQ